MPNNLNNDIIDRDDSLSFDDLSKNIDLTIDSEKNSFIKLIQNNKDNLISEINKNNILREEKRNKQINYILKHNKDKIDLSNVIIDMLDDKELKILYDKVVYNNRPIIKKIIEFLFFNKENQNA